MDCKLCHSANVTVSKEVHSSIIGLDYRLWKCSNCGSSFFDEKQHPVKIEAMYESLSLERKSFPVEFSPSKTWLKQKDNIIRMLGHSPKSILDVGCRTGDFLMHFDAGTKRTGIELSSHFADIGKQRGLNIIQDSLENIAFEEQYEVVSCYAILEHLYDPLKFLNSIQGLVKTDGLLVIMIPSIQTLKASFEGLKWHMFSPPEHLNFYSRNFIDTYLQKSNFKRVSRYYSAGGMLKYKGSHPLVIKTEAAINELIDFSFLSKWPIFDHMYSYYRRK
jgi:SAM-dependent methyltransferase